MALLYPIRGAGRRGRHHRGRDTGPGLQLALAAVLLAGFNCAAQAASENEKSTLPPAGVSHRIVEVKGLLGSEVLGRHLEFSAARGFNAVWIGDRLAGAWRKKDDARSPRLHPRFLELAAWCRSREIRIFVAIAPDDDPEHPFAFQSRRSRKRLLRFVKLLRQKAGVREFVLDFRDAPAVHEELGQIVAFGRNAAGAHLAATGSVASRLRDGERIWFAPATTTDRELEQDPDGYASALLAGLAATDPRIGLVWEGTEPRSRTLTGTDLLRARERLGNRELIFVDAFPDNGDRDGATLALTLGPLRHRDPSVAAQLYGYVARPMHRLAGSRLALSTVADFLKNPRGYEPDRSWEAAIAALAGDDEAAREALRVQALEWGGWFGELNFRTSATDHPDRAPLILRDPAFSASFTWTVRRYEERMAALAGLRDTAFRDDLLEVMGYRLAIGRLVPLVREATDLTRGDPRAEALIGRMREARRASRKLTGALAVVDRFLAAADLPDWLLQRVTADLAPDQVPAGTASGAM